MWRRGAVTIMELQAIRNLTDEELKAQAVQAGERIFRIRFQKSMGNLEGLGALKAHKTEIARVKTVQREREIVVSAPATQEKKAAPAASTRTLRKKAQKA